MKRMHSTVKVKDRPFYCT